MTHSALQHLSHCAVREVGGIWYWVCAVCASPSAALRSGKGVARARTGVAAGEGGPYINWKQMGFHAKQQQ